MPEGKFITLEGGEGAGKSTQTRLLAERLREAGHDILVTREPGGAPAAEAIREFLLSGQAEAYGPMGEAVLFSVARDEHLEETVRPALERGAWVISDRFADSTRAYQGAGGLKPQVIRALERLIVGPTRPDLTLILDLPPEEGLARARHRAGNGTAAGADKDPFERKTVDYHRALRQAFLEIATEEPERCAVVDASLPEGAVADAIWRAVRDRLAP